MIVRAALLSVLVLVVQVNGHARFVCPSAQYPNSGFKSGPCGDTGYAGTENNYMEVKPGPMTLRFEETIFHTDAPTSIRLLKRGDDSTHCNLLDHIPHNNAATVSFFNFFTTCKLNGFPVGRCKDSTSYITVIIPDIECDDCYLQMTSVMTDKYNDAQEPCVQQSPVVNNCSTYYSCSNIKIRPTKYGRGRGLESCQNDTDLSSFYKTWPYTTEHGNYKHGIYRDLGADFTLKQWFPRQLLLSNNAAITPSHPVGDCVSNDGTTVAFFDTTSGGSLRGVVSLTTFAGTSTSISGMVFGDSSVADNSNVDLRLGNTQLLKNDEYYIRNNVIYINAVNKMASHGTGDRLSLSVDGRMVSSQPSRRGIQTKIFTTVLGPISPQPRYGGEAVFELTESGLDYVILMDLSNFPINETVDHVSIDGPTGEVFDLTSSIKKTKGDKLVVLGRTKFTSSEHILQAQSGLLTVDIRTSGMTQDDNRQIRGVIPRFTRCDEAGANDRLLCQTSLVTKDGQPVDRGLSSTTPFNGRVAFMLHSNGTKLQISGLIHDLSDPITLNSFEVVDNSNRVVLFNALNSTRTAVYSNYMSKTMFFEAEVSVSKNFARLSRKSSPLDVILNTSQESLRGKLPSIISEA